MRETDAFCLSVPHTLLIIGFFCLARPLFADLVSLACAGVKMISFAADV